jgi:two-component system chemotaxis response regulator CheB
VSRRPRVLIVDDSAFARTVLSRLLRVSSQIDVIGTARDGNDALEKINALEPDVVTLDLTMPELDGLGVLRALEGRKFPKVIIVSISGVDTELGAEALTLGAVDIVTKPTARADDRLHAIGIELIAKVLAAGAPLPDNLPIGATQHPLVIPSTRAELVMIGTSTGGPQALTRIIGALPANLGAPVTIALHIPAGYTEALAKRLDRISAIRVVEASDGLELVPGLVAIAPGGSHLRVNRIGGVLRAEISHVPHRPFAPSVDELFLSGARAAGAQALAIILTGMGDDGLEGSRAVAAAGGSLLTEAAGSCVVYGMPRSVQEADIGAASASLEHIAAEIARRV